MIYSYKTHECGYGYMNLVDISIGGIDSFPVEKGDYVRIANFENWSKRWTLSEKRYEYLKSIKIMSELVSEEDIINWVEFGGRFPKIKEQQTKENNKKDNK